MKNFVNVDTRFQKSINLTLDTGDMALVNRYIPTRSSVSILKQYLTNIVRGQGEHATILIGPYGKGKSHLLLVLLALLCKSKDETAEIQKKIIEADNSTKLLFMELAEVGRPFLPVIVSSFQGDLNESFIFALQEALKKKNIKIIYLSFSHYCGSFIWFQNKCANALCYNISFLYYSLQREHQQKTNFVYGRWGVDSY